MPNKTIKVGISLPAADYRRVEKLRRRLHLSRSATVSAALRALLAAGEEEEKIRVYLEGYRRFPETLQEQTIFRAVAAQVLSNEEWKE